MKRFRLIILGLIIALSIQVNAQDDSNKIEFVYKTIDNHEIKANIFLPSNDDLHLSVHKALVIPVIV